MTQRVHWIDITRGIGIILVLYGHLFSTDQQRYLIYAFHMPLFFFVSGLVFKPLTNKSLLSITIKYFKQLLIPYYIFAVMTYLFALISQTADFSLGGMGYQLFGILYGSGRDGMLGYNVVLWFLPCLFITKFLFAIITKRVSHTGKLLLILGVSAGVGSLLSLYTPLLKLPFGLEIALSALPFFGFGYLFRIHENFLATFMRYRLPIAAVAMTALVMVANADFFLSGHQIDMRVNQLDVTPLFYLGAFSGIIGWTAISQLIAKNTLLEYIGKHSLVIFAWHNILLIDLRQIVNSVLTHDILSEIQPFMATVYMSMAIAIILASRKLVVKLKVAYRFVPFLKQ